MGNRLEVHRLEARALHPNAVYELTFCDAYSDLLCYGLGFTALREIDEVMRTMFMMMLNSAIVEAGPRLFDRPPPTPIPIVKGAPFVKGKPSGGRGRWSWLRRRS